MSKALFCFFYHDYREAEWAMPIMRHLSRKGFDVQILLPVSPSTSRQRRTHAWLCQFDFAIHYANDVFAGDNFLLRAMVGAGRKLEGSFSFQHRLLKQVLNPTGYLFRKSGFSSGLYVDRLANLFKQFDHVFVAQGLLSKFTKNSLPHFALRASSQAQISIVEYPISAVRFLKATQPAFIEVHRPSTREYSTLAADTDTKVFGVGHQRFTGEWLELIRNMRRAEISETLGAEASGGKKKVLFGLKNRTDVLTDFMSFEAQMQVRANIAKRIIGEGHFPIIKPHPGIRQEEMRYCLRDIDSSKYLISHLPLTSLAEECAVTIFEFFSSGMFEIYANAKPVYWPADLYLDAANCKDMAALKAKVLFCGIPEQYWSFPRLRFPSQSDDEALTQEEINVRSQFLDIPRDVEKSMAGLLAELTGTAKEQ